MFLSSPASYAQLFVSLFSELHPVHPVVHLRPADVDGQPVHFRLWLLQRRDHRQVLQTVRPAEGAGVGGERRHLIKPYKTSSHHTGSERFWTKGEIHCWSLWVINWWFVACKRTIKALMRAGIPLFRYDKHMYGIGIHTILTRDRVSKSQVMVLCSTSRDPINQMDWWL